MSIENPISNKRVKSKKDSIHDFICENAFKDFYVCTHDNPDPDGLACIYGMLRILQFLGVEKAGGYYCGEISHPQNRAMINVLNIPAKKWTKEIEKNVPEDAIFIFVDCVGSQKNMGIAGVPAITIDHHKSSPKSKLFIHDEVGACSTLIIDLMLSMPSQTDEQTESVSHCFDTDVDDIKEISTALAIGIKTDTIDFRSETTTDDDFKAHRFLSKYLSDDNFNKIVNYKLPAYVYESEESAWKNRKQDGPNLITGLGFVDPSRSDCIPYLADHLMRLEGIQTVLVYAIVGNAVRASLRTTSASVDAESLCHEIFGEGNGGGKHGIAGATVNFNVFDTSFLGDEDKGMLWEITKSQIEKRFAVTTQK